MANKFIGFLETIGKDFKRGLMDIQPYTEGAAEVGIAVFAPELGPLFNKVASAVMLAEQSSTAAGKTQNGPDKLASVLQLIGPLIASTLTDLTSHPASTPQSYISAVVTILNGIAMKAPSS